MANKLRGEVELKAGDQTYTLAFTVNALCELEELLQKPISEILPDVVRVPTARAVLWSCLLHHHRMTIEDAGIVMHEAGPTASVLAVHKAIAAAFPPTEVSAKNG